MPEKCPHCGKLFENSKALGSHVYYIHTSKNPVQVYRATDRSESEKQRFRQLLYSCITETGLQTPTNIGKIEQAIEEIPEGISPTIDDYRSAFSCALKKERLIKEVEEIIEDAKRIRPE